MKSNGAFTRWERSGSKPLFFRCSPGGARYAESPLMPHRLFLLCTAISLLALLPAGGWAFGQPSDHDRAAAIKAGMVVNFIRYTRWPEASFEHENSPIIVTILGDDEIDQALLTALRGQTIGNRPIELRRRFHPPVPRGGFSPHAQDLERLYRDLRGSHVVFFGGSERNRVEAHLRGLDKASVLTISDIPNFAERGGMLGFAVRDRRVAFDANVDAINDTELRVSSQVLNLARIVRRKSEGSGSESGGGQ